jgi:hypothetical protein
MRIFGEVKHDQFSGVLWLTVVFNFLAFCFLGHLIYFHIRLYFMGKSTYEYIRWKENRTRESKIVTRIKKPDIEESEIKDLDPDLKVKAQDSGTVRSNDFTSFSQGSDKNHEGLPKVPSRTIGFKNLINIVSSSFASRKVSHDYSINSNNKVEKLSHEDSAKSVEPEPVNLTHESKDKV